MPWNSDLQDAVLQCVVDHDHNTYQKKNTGTRMLYDGATGTFVEVDILTQTRTDQLAPIQDEATALATVSRAMDLGLFPDKQQSPAQLQLLAQVAFAYGLDPLMGEIMPFQGKPYITIGGRRRLDNVAGNKCSVSYRPPTEDEERYYTKTKAMGPDDFIQICVGKDMASGATVEGFGRVLSKERTAQSQGARDNLPLINRTIEMAQKRAERRMREQMYLSLIHI